MNINFYPYNKQQQLICHLNDRRWNISECWRSAVIVFEPFKFPFQYTEEYSYACAHEFPFNMH